MAFTELITFSNTCVPLSLALTLSSSGIFLMHVEMTTYILGLKPSNGSDPYYLHQLLHDSTCQRQCRQLPTSSPLSVHP